MLSYMSLAALVAFALAVLMGRPYIHAMQAWKLGQIIRAEGPQAHLAKAGTPSMGGWIILGPGLIALAVFSPPSWEVLALGLTILGFALVGWLDDYLIVKKKHNKGLPARQKLAGQIVVGVCFAIALARLGHPTSVLVPFSHGAIAWNLGWGYYALLVFVMVGTSNAVNLTDGLDGLAAGTVVIALLGLAWCLKATMGFPAAAGVEVVIAAMMGGCLGFLWYNCHPAQIFMGDTGSLGLGAAVAGAAVLGHLEFWLIPLGAVFIAETLSVMLQVVYFKRTGGKRLFKMSPLHHHYELSGWLETKVVFRFYLAAAAGALVAIGLF